MGIEIGDTRHRQPRIPIIQVDEPVAVQVIRCEMGANLIAGVVALYERPYRNGDSVTIGETYGEVQSIDLRTVQIVTPDDTLVSIPHGKIWTTAIYNGNCGQRDLLCVADFYLHPDHDGTLRRREGQHA